MSQVTSDHDPAPHASGPAIEPDELGPAADGRSTRWASHRVSRRAALVDAARHAVHRYGPEVSMEQIATVAGTSKSIVYRYFQDKSGLQVAVGQAVLAQIHDELDAAARDAATPRDGLRAMIGAYLAMIDHSPRVYWFVTRPIADPAPLGHVLDEVTRRVARPFAGLVGNADPVLVDAWASAAVGFVRGAGEWWLAHREDRGAPPLPDLADQLTDWLWRGPVSTLAGPGR